MATSDTPAPGALRGTTPMKMVGDLLDALSKVAAAVLALFGSYSAVVGQGHEQAASFVLVLAALAVLIWRLWPARPISIALPGTPAIRGLVGFNESDAARLFGRDNEVGTLLGKVENDQWRVCLVQGEPSSGKTSLLRAGLVPRLKGDVWLPIYVQVAQIAAEPLNEIRRELACAGQFDAGDLPLVEVIRRCADQTRRTPVIVCDQFERLFVSAATDDARTRLFDAIRQCLADNDLPVRFVLSSRTGFAGAEALERALGRAIPLPSQMTVSRLAPERADDVLARMAQHDNTPFTGGLRSAIVSDLTHDRTVCPAELQIVSTWVRDKGVTSRAGYEGIGRASGSFWDYIRVIVKSVDDVTPVGAARHVLSVLAERARTAATRDQILESYGEPGHATNVLEQEALERALQHLVDNGIVSQVMGGGYQLIHAYFSKSITIALSGPTSRWLMAWWRSRQMVTAYGIRSAVLAVGTLVGCAAAAVVLGAPAAQPRWALAGHSATLDASALFAFDPENAYLAADDGSQFVVWDLLPDRLLALDIPPRQPLRTIARPPGSAGIPNGLVPTSVGFLSDGSEAYEVSLDAVVNRWRVDRIRLKDSQPLVPLEGVLSPPDDKGKCAPKAAAYSFAVDTVAVAYSCGQIVLLPSGRDPAKQVRVVAADEDKSCWPAKMALSGSEKHLTAIYSCVDAAVGQTSKLRTWDLGRPEPVEWATVSLDFAENSAIEAVMFRWDGHVTVGVGSGADVAVYDVSTPKPEELVHNVGNRADPRVVWLGADGRVAAVQPNSNPPQLQLHAVDLWVGPLRVPTFLPFRRDVSDVGLSL